MSPQIRRNLGDPPTIFGGPSHPFGGPAPPRCVKPPNQQWGGVLTPQTPRMGVPEGGTQDKSPKNLRREFGGPSHPFGGLQPPNHPWGGVLTPQSPQVGVPGGARGTAGGGHRVPSLLGGQLGKLSGVGGPGPGGVRAGVPGVSAGRGGGRGPPEPPRSPPGAPPEPPRGRALTQGPVNPGWAARPRPRRAKVGLGARGGGFGVPPTHRDRPGTPPGVTPVGTEGTEPGWGQP